MAENKPLRDIRMAISFRGNTPTVINNRTPEAENNTSQPKPRVYTLDNYKWTEYNYENNPNSASQQIPNKLILTEFQPERTYNFGDILKNNSLAKSITSFLSTGVGSAITQTGAKSYQQTLIDKYSGSPEELTDIGSKSMDLIENLMKGQYLNTYEIPYHETTFFNADNTDSWSAVGSESAMGGELSQVIQNNGAINFPMPAQWNNNGNGNGMQITPSEFYLINDKTTDLFKNFQFLFSFAAGAFWIQADYMQMSPNLYDIECPGVFHRHWVAMGINVTREGKLRRNSELVNLMVGSQFNGITKDTLFPEAYKVTCTFKDLTPNSYNCWASYMLNGKNSSNIGDTTTGGFVEEGLNNLRQLPGKAADKIAGGLNSLYNYEYDPNKQIPLSSTQ